jgi:hypothetical protein
VRSCLMLAWLFALQPVQAQAGDRTLMHTFERDSQIVSVAIVDLPSGPQGIVSLHNPDRMEHPVTVSQAEFDKMWKTLMTSGVERYAGDETSKRTFDAVNYYLFSVSEMPEGKKTNYVIPKSKTAPPLIALADHLRGYAK